jgi:hypothetical protein
MVFPTSKSPTIYANGIQGFRVSLGDEKKKKKILFSILLVQMTMYGENLRKHLSVKVKVRGIYIYIYIYIYFLLSGPVFLQ